MKKILAVILLAVSCVAQAQIYGIGVGTITLPNLATQTDNTVVGNGTGSVASPTALAVPSCSTASSALTWTSNTGFGCNTITSGAALSGITAAAAGNTIASGNNHSQLWNWALTSNSVDALRFGETTAATGGTSTSGVPNQYIGAFRTLAASTASPFGIYVRGAHVLSASATTSQMYATTGSVSAPTYSFAAGTTTGVYFESTPSVRITAGGVLSATFGGGFVALQDGTAALPAIGFLNDSGTGFSRVGGNLVMSTNNGKEQIRWLTGIQRNSYAENDTTAYQMQFRKARTTVAAPSVITTGDDLGIISGSGYVGATGTYVEGARITFDSTGAIANTTSGLGGIIRFSHAKVGTVGVTEVAAIKEGHIIALGTAPTFTGGNCGTSPVMEGKDDAISVTIGTGGTDTVCGITFANAFTTNAPVCIAQSNTDIVPFKIVTTTTTVTVTATLAFTAGSKLHILCKGWE